MHREDLLQGAAKLRKLAPVNRQAHKFLSKAEYGKISEALITYNHKFER